MRGIIGRDRLRVSRWFAIHAPHLDFHECEAQAAKALGEGVFLEALACPGCQRVLLDDYEVGESLPPTHTCDACGTNLPRLPNTVANPYASFFPRLIDREIRILKTRA